MPAPSEPKPAKRLDCEAAAEFAVLTSELGQTLMASVGSIRNFGPADMARWRTLADPEWVAAALRIVQAQRQGAGKFTRAATMWFSAKGLQQSTAETVARHKAARFCGDSVVDLCAGIGGDSIALAKSNRVVAVDLDPAMTARTAWNASVYQVAERVEAVTGRAEEFDIPSDAWIHVDPDRRATSTRKSNVVAEYAPGLRALLDWTRAARGGAIKLGPASDFAAHFDDPQFEVEVISLNGECKEATVWFGDIASPGICRRATSLPTGATWIDADSDGGGQRPEPPGALDRWVFDPDPALVRAGLLDGFAQAHGWRRIEAGVDLLTGSERSASPFVANFEVLELFPLDLKVLRRVVKQRCLGPLEIKTRGLQTLPEVWRAQLRPSGPHPATWILVAGRHGSGQAILARRG